MTDIVVVGGGSVGALTALGIARSGRSVLLMDRQEPERARGRLGIDIRNLAVSPGSREVMERCGVWSELDAAAYTRMVVWEEWGTRVMEFAAADAGRGELGWIVESSELVSAIWEALRATGNAIVRVGVAVTDVRPADDGVLLCTDHGELSARLLIAADGSRSRIRTALNVPTREMPTGHHGLTTVIQTARGHDGTAFQRFLLDGPLAVLPSAKERLASVVWSQSPDRAEQRLALSEAEFCRDIQRAMESRLGTVEAVDQRFAFPLTQTLVQTFNPHPRVLLIGDAARVLHPLAGLGANVGFEDVRDLLADLDDVGGDPGAPGLWRKFARQRRARAQMMLGLMVALRRCYAAGGPVAQLLRNAGVAWLNGAEAVKGQLIREAMGLGPLARRW